MFSRGTLRGREGSPLFTEDDLLDDRGGREGRGEEVSVWDRKLWIPSMD